MDTRVVYCGDNLEQFAKLPHACGDFAHCLPCVLNSIRQITPLTARQIRVEMIQQKKRPALFQSTPERARLGHSSAITQWQSLSFFEKMARASSAMVLFSKRIISS